MTTMTIERDGRLSLPPDIQERCGMLPETSVRVIETRNGLLLVPLTDAPMSLELTEELQEWQNLSQSTWAQFSYEEEV
jgi:bifunctional DNA-binding transcriptional regulator/antitoxin component of YhaV-PrlF toxin-antitoxin module